jgi:hypothetical protein
MNHKTRLALGLAAAFLAAGAFAQETDAAGDAARQARMDEAYRNHQERPTTVASAEDATRRDAHEAGHSFHTGLRATGHAIHNGVRATGHAVHTGVKETGHAIHTGVKETGHAIHRGVDKVTGK